ncbi:MAG: dihydropteroate synthase [Clostridiales bacterium]|jgi:dihydropteroate synthase|nr:dihydropteroate synthase [Clostridiales bacterium]
MKIGDRSFKIGSKTYIVGILNVTPDSFSDGGKYFEREKAINRAKQMVKDGADIIDIGCESTRPGFTPCTVSEELLRFNEYALPVIKAMKEIGIPVSIDTTKPEIAEIAIRAGSSMINDIWGFRDKKMIEICAKHNVCCCLMHNRTHENYDNFLQNVLSDLSKGIKNVLNNGIKRENIIVDPGIGFAKNRKQEVLIIRNLKIFKGLGFPLLIGVSRKRVIGEILNLPIEHRLEGTIASSVVAIENGCDFLRVHDILENKRAAIFADAIYRYIM